VVIITDYELVLAFGSLILVTLAFFSAIYYRWIFRLKKEYDSAKNIIRGIVLEFNKRQKEQIAKTESLIYDVEAARSTSEKVTEQVYQEEKRIEKLISSIEVALTANAKTATHLLKVYEKLTAVGETQDIIQKQLNAISEKQATLPLLEPRLKTQMIEQEDVLSKLTDTERIVIQMLASEGTKPAPEIGKRIGRSREHTARLMKKLFGEGYIERETYKIPYIYRLNQKLKETLEKQKTEVGQ
jgi:predicted transcriptional regulator